MSCFSGKHIVIGISGGIAAYKAPDLVRRLIERGAQVRVVMTQGAQAFITPMTLQAVSGHPVSTDLLDPSAESSMGHIELAKWADAILIAPCTADVIAKLAAGMADNLLTTLCLATEAPVCIAPAMNQQMYKAAATQENLKRLKQRGLQIYGPGSGEQACGDVGPGRMLEPMQLVDSLSMLLQPALLEGVKICITAGPTREPLDPVRYLSNHSSGKMGFALAEAAAQMGAAVALISGPVSLPTPAGVERVDVTTAAQMHQAALKHASDSDIFIGCAAVADYRAEQIAPHKLKKQSGEERTTVTLVKNPDIIAEIAALDRSSRPFVVGFAAETQDVVQYAKQKLERKGLDMIAANDVSDPSLGFNTDSNAITLISHAGEQHLPAQAKSQLAIKLLTLIEQGFRK